MVMVNYIFQMEAHIVDIFVMEQLEGMADYFIQMVIFIQANGKMIKHMAEELITLSTEENIKENGNQICGKVKERKSFKMEPDLKDIIIRIKRVVKENFTGLMVIHILETLEIIKDKEKES